MHGRHVMKPEDIEPVAGEYQRYKVGGNSDPHTKKDSSSDH